MTHLVVPKVSSLATVAPLVALLWLPACAPPTSDAGQPRGIQADYGPQGRLTRLVYDRDGNGRVDTWGYMDGTRVIRVETDEDGDGTVDRWEFHRAAETTTTAKGAGSPEEGVDRTVERIERATRHDGRVDRKEYFENGALVRVESDGDGDGRVDKWETYANGTLNTMAIDTQHLGRPDRRLVYAADGSFVRVEADVTGSGHFTPVAQ